MRFNTDTKHIFATRKQILTLACVAPAIRGYKSAVSAPSSSIAHPTAALARSPLRLGRRLGKMLLGALLLSPALRAPIARMALEPIVSFQPVAVYEEIVLPSPSEGPPRQEITVVDLMPHIAKVLDATGLREGTVNVISQHTTCGITINEWESRLARDLRSWLLRLAPPDDRSEIGAPEAKVSYLHNDIDVRPESDDERQRCLENGWDVDDPTVLQAWRDQEPINAHSHLAAMLLGCSETVPVTKGKLQIGQWQSVMLVDTDGPRQRKVGIQVIGFK